MFLCDRKLYKMICAGKQTPSKLQWINGGSLLKSSNNNNPPTFFHGVSYYLFSLYTVHNTYPGI